jgi:hypothetical protein
LLWSLLIAHFSAVGNIETGGNKVDVAARISNQYNRVVISAHDETKIATGLDAQEPIYNQSSLNED